MPQKAQKPSPPNREILCLLCLFAAIPRPLIARRLPLLACPAMSVGAVGGYSSANRQTHAACSCLRMQHNTEYFLPKGDISLRSPCRAIPCCAVRSVILLVIGHSNPPLYSGGARGGASLHQTYSSSNPLPVIASRLHRAVNGS